MIARNFANCGFFMFSHAEVVKWFAFGGQGSAKGSEDCRAIPRGLCFLLSSPPLPVACLEE